MKIVAYDYDGVLAVKPPASEKKWGRMKGPERKARQEQLLKWYQWAPPILVPAEEQFFVITARKNTEEVKLVSHEWLYRRYQLRVQKVFFLSESRSIKNVVKFKAAALAEIGATDFIEDNLTVLKGLRGMVKCRLWYFDPEQRLILLG